LNELDQRVAQYEEDNDDDDDADFTEFSQSIADLQEYQDYLSKTAQCAFISQRATKLENEMRHKFRDYDPHPIRVFSVSSAMYIDWMKKRQPERPILTPEMTGIPKLRRFLLGIPAEQNFDCYIHHVSKKLPAFLEQVPRIADHEKKDDAYAIIRPRFMELVEELATKCRSALEDFQDNRIRRVWENEDSRELRLQGVRKVILSWASDVRWNTYNKVLREKGIVKKSDSKRYRGGPINWNDELSQEICYSGNVR
jgi:hypothetical protein